MCILAEQNQTESLIGRVITAEPHIGTDYRFDARRLRGTVELYKREEVTLLGDRASRHAGLSKRLDQRRDPQGSIDQRVFGMKV